MIFQVELNGEKMKAIQEGKLKMEEPSYPEIKITTQDVDEISGHVSLKQDPFIGIFYASSLWIADVRVIRGSF